eukprot:859582-Pelagomonas_calceolata.AAC.2
MGGGAAPGGAMAHGGGACVGACRHIQRERGLINGAGAYTLLGGGDAGLAPPHCRARVLLCYKGTHVGAVTEGGGGG